MWTYRTRIVPAILFSCIGSFFVQSRMSQEDRKSPSHDTPNATKELGYDWDLRLAAAHRLGEARQRVARQVLAGRLSLLLAASRYQDLNECHDDFSWDQFRVHFPGANDDERACRQVIQFAKIELEHIPELSIFRSRSWSGSWKTFYEVGRSTCHAERGQAERLDFARRITRNLTCSFRGTDDLVGLQL
jgi:hypothetical protein